jgi:tetratricopeptide (TPR) repeat protein
MKFLTKIKLALAFQTSLNYDAEKKYQKIIDKLEKYRSFVEDEMKNTFPEFYILLGEAYFNITNYRIAEGYLLKALETTKKDTKLNHDEINYLNIHIYYWLYLTYKHLNDEAKAFQCSNLYRETTYNEKNIRRYIKNNFPCEETI